MPNKTSFMYPSLHEDVENAVSDDIGSIWFQEKDSDKGANHNYDTHIMATFRCCNSSCSKHGWGSKKVSILIRGYPNNGYNAVVFNQRCKACHKLGKLSLDVESYVDRVAYRLTKWAGLVNTEKQPYKQKEGPPHVSSLCEGCKRGFCQNKIYGY